MSIKSALIELKELIKLHHGQVDEPRIQELEIKNNLQASTLVYYFNIMYLCFKNAEHRSHSLEDSKKINRKWTKDEIGFMYQYIEDRQKEGVHNITEILDEVAILLDRGYQSVNYKYYSINKMQEKNTQSNGRYQFTTISEDQIPVIATEVVEEKFEPLQPLPSNTVQEDDLLDVLSGLITNIQQLPGMNLNQLLRSLYQLTNMAIQNQDALRLIELNKKAIQDETTALKDKLAVKEQQLVLERQRNNELQLEVAKLAKEINAFNQLGDAAKIQNLKSYNTRLNYIIDGFGMVQKVGS